MLQYFTMSRSLLRFWQPRYWPLWAGLGLLRLLVLLPYRALLAAGNAHYELAAWLLHHPARGPRADGQTSRGSGALTGFADVVMEMSCYRRARSRAGRARCDC